MRTHGYLFQRYGFYQRRDVATALAPDYSFEPQRGSWGISGIVRFGPGPNYVFFVSFGQSQAGYEFDEGIYSNGIMRWQSQPNQKLTAPMIQQLIKHNHLQNDILLFLRTKLDGPYMFMGFLKYVNHDQEREQPVHFHWQILDFDSTRDYISLLDLRLEPATDVTPALDALEQQGVSQSLDSTPPPPTGDGSKGVGVSTAQFRRSPVDYEERDRKNRKMGKVGEDLVFAYERTELVKSGRQDLADRVEMVCRTIGDAAGFDVRSFDKNTGDEIHVEVKTTSGPLTTPFFMSAAEMEYAKNCPHCYKIYRLYAYSADAHKVQFFTIEKPLETLDFTPTIFRVRQK